MRSLVTAWANVPDGIRDRLVKTLSRPERVYHSIHHINQLLIDADRYCPELVCPQMHWAILYHDIVYDALSNDGSNELASGQAFYDAFPVLESAGLGIERSWKDSVFDAICATRNHFDRQKILKEAEPWQQAFLDLDLGGLGDHSSIFESNSILIEREYALVGVTRQQWVEGRIRFFQNALRHETIFHVVHLDREDQARANMSDALAELRIEAQANRWIS